MEDQIDQIASELWQDSEPQWAEPTAVYDGEDREVTDGGGPTAMTGHLAFDQSDLANPLMQQAGPDFADNSQNSFEQEVALKRWVDHAVDMLNRGELRDAILADLAHDGCPDAESVLRRAEQQPQKPAPDPQAPDAGQPQSPTEDQPTQVQQANPGVQAAAHPEEKVQQIAEATSSPVDQIRDFINQFPAVDETSAPDVRDKHANVRKARVMCQNAVLKGHYEAAGLDSRLKAEQERLMGVLQGLAETAQQANASGRNSRHMEVVHQASMGGYDRGGSFVELATDTMVYEASRIDVGIELGETIPIMLAEGYAPAAVHQHALSRFSCLTGEAHTAALAAAEALIDSYVVVEPKTHVAAVRDPEIDYDGPADELFL